MRTGRRRRLRGGASVEEYTSVNTEEGLGRGLCVGKILEVRIEKLYCCSCVFNIIITLSRTQLEFLRKKGKSWTGTGVVLWIMLKTRFLWKRFL